MSEKTDDLLPFAHKAGAGCSYCGHDADSDDWSMCVSDCKQRIRGSCESVPLSQDGQGSTMSEHPKTDKADDIERAYDRGF